MKRLLLLSLLPVALMAADIDVRPAAINASVEKSLQNAPKPIRDLIEAFKACYHAFITNAINQQALDAALYEEVRYQLDPAQIDIEIEVDQELRDLIFTEAAILGLAPESFRIYGVASEKLPSCGSFGSAFVVNIPRLLAHSIEAQRFIIRNNLIQLMHNDNELINAANTVIPDKQAELAKFDNLLTIRSDLLAAAGSAEHARGGYKAVTGEEFNPEEAMALDYILLPALDQYDDATRAGLLTYIYQCHTA